MVKTGFLKTIKNNLSFSKPFIVLGLVIILSIVLFSSYNNYSVENFKPKPGVKLEVRLWVSALGSLDNTFVRSQWLDFVNKYDKFPSIEFGYGKAVDFTKYLETDKNTGYKDFEKLDYVRPPFNTFVSILIVGTKDGLKYKYLPTALIADKSLTLEYLTLQLNRVFLDNYSMLYDNASSDPENAMPSTPPEMPKIQKIPTEIPTVTPDLPKMPAPWL